jgi:superfamily II DNA or RNA helicase
MLSLRYDRGTIVLSQTGEGGRSDDALLRYGSRLPVWLKWDGDRSVYRALAYKYRDLVHVLKKLGVEFADEVMNPLDCPKLSASIDLYDFQKEALEAWMKRRAGSLVIPTGGGKTIVAMKAMAELGVPTLVIAPTLELVDQWADRMGESFGIRIGKYTGSEKTLEPLTVATYDTAFLRAHEMGDRFMLVVFDETHHLAAPGYLQIAEMLAAPWRMGLTATYEREDKAHKNLDEVLGGKAYEISLDALKGKHLSDFVTKKIVVSMLPEEKREYDRMHSKYLEFLRSKGIRMRSHADFERFVVLSGRDPEGREALLAKNRAREIALGSNAKVVELGKILRLHRGERTIIFTEYNDLVHKISREFLIPGITHRTPKGERVETFASFRNGEYSRIVTSKVLEEGIDVPEASVGVILSGSGSVREYKQRLGRILRRREEKLAVLYEIVSHDTVEVGTSYRRHRKKMG